jgi:hypothetical protein
MVVVAVVAPTLETFAPPAPLLRAWQRGIVHASWNHLVGSIAQRLKCPLDQVLFRWYLDQRWTARFVGKVQAS